MSTDRMPTQRQCRKALRDIAAHLDALSRQRGRIFQQVQMDVHFPTRPVFHTGPVAGIENTGEVTTTVRIESFRPISKARGVR